MTGELLFMLWTVYVLFLHEWRWQQHYLETRRDD